MLAINKVKKGESMKLYTMGFTKKSAKDFFTILKRNNIEKLIDIRLNNASQLAGFTKGNDLKYFLKEICDIEYIHDTDLSPNKEILDDYKNKKISWSQYEILFNSLLKERKINSKLEIKYNNQFDNICLLCSEVTADNCHRRLVAEYIKNNNPDLNIEIIHL
jgi:uncharacterized protein (DUF488 family)